MSPSNRTRAGGSFHWSLGLISRDYGSPFDQITVSIMCPLQSIWVTFARDRCAYVVDLTLYTGESTAFTRQGSLVQILSPPPFSTDFRPFSRTIFHSHKSLSEYSTQMETESWDTSDSAMAVIRPLGTAFNVFLPQILQPQNLWKVDVG